MSHFGSIPSMMVSASAICEKYAFDASAQTVRVDDDIKQFLMIINLTDGLVIYNPANPATNGTVVGKSVLLTYDTTPMDDNDDLLVFCEMRRDNPELEVLKSINDNLTLVNAHLKEGFETGI